MAVKTFLQQNINYNGEKKVGQKDLFFQFQNLDFRLIKIYKITHLYTSGYSSANSFKT